MNTDTLKQLRAALARIDRRLLNDLAERGRIAEKIGAFKADAGREIEDPNREEYNKSVRAELCKELGLDPEYVERVFEILVRESRRLQS